MYFKLKLLSLGLSAALISVKISFSTTDEDVSISFNVLLTEFSFYRPLQFGLGVQLEAGTENTFCCALFSGV